MTSKTSHPPLADTPCLIEHQFPVARVSAESYKERKAGRSQTLTGLGKWWGRKPLILVRAALLGLLLPASDDPIKDGEIFLKLLTMDAVGLRRRKSKPIPAARLLQELPHMPPSARQRFLAQTSEKAALQLRSGLSRAEKEDLQQSVFDRLPYSEKLEYCDRPEQLDGPTPEDWQMINAHLGTHASNLAELVVELGELRFGRRPRVGDAFCGGGSIPFEAARLGCDAYGSDLNPVAALLTWASLNLIGGGEDIAAEVRQTQTQIFQAVDRQITEWGIEHNTMGWRAEAFLYCVEVTDPETGWKIPLAPSWVIAQKYGVIAKLVPDDKNKRFEIEIIEGAPDNHIKDAKNAGTIIDSRLVPPYAGTSIPVEVVRRNMRLWENSDIVPRHDDVFRERLYCIRWLETFIDDNGELKTRRHYRAPTPEDLRREDRTLELLLERFEEWQAKGFVPSRKIEPGQETTRLQRERGWTYWHHLFNPRQLLIQGLLNQYAIEYVGNSIEKMVTALLGTSSCCNWNSRLCIWNSDASKGPGNTEQTFANQALNTQFNYGCRGLNGLETAYYREVPIMAAFQSKCNVEPCDARSIQTNCDIWITDPPYADAVNYEEISEFFLAWHEGGVKKIFPNWIMDSRRASAIKGQDESFRLSLAESYSRLVSEMPSNGVQIVMFTHQNAAVWADLTLILWAAGLRVTAAWTIATETNSGLKEGNYVQGTVLLVLRKRIEVEPVFLDEINHKVETEVRRQLDEMTRLEDDSDPNFGDADYQLAAYAAALRVLTERPIEEINPEKEILRIRKPDEESPVEKLIRRAVKVACDYLVPHGLDADLWKTLGPLERFYLKGLEVESHGEYRAGVYQELARGFGAAEYTTLMDSTKANESRLKSASEFGRRMLSGEGFGSSLVRQCLFAISVTVKSEDTREGLDYLHTELPNYWANREKIIHLLEYLSQLRHMDPMRHWQKDSHAAGLLAGAIRNDHI